MVKNIHQVGATSDSADGHSTADHLAENGQVRLYSADALKAAATNPEAHHLVHDQKDT